MTKAYIGSSTRFKCRIRSSIVKGGFDTVIGNPPYVDIKGLPSIDVQYLFTITPAIKQMNHAA
jgi:hypothetical protein